MPEISEFERCRIAPRISAIMTEATTDLSLDDIFYHLWNNGISLHRTRLIDILSWMRFN